MNNSTKKTHKSLVYITIITLVVLATSTVAYYRKATNGSITGSTVTWSFKADNSTSTFTKALGDIYPGQSGSFQIILDATNAETDVNYTITPNIPTNLSGLKLYSDSSMTTEVSVASPLNGLIDYSVSPSSTLTIYWAWEYDVGVASITNVSFSIDVTGKQV